MSRHSLLRAGFGSFLLLFVVIVVGCSRSSSLGERAPVSGTVLYKGKPLPGGRITFVNVKGDAAFALIDPQGHYQFQAPVGEVLIAVDNHFLLKEKSSKPVVLKGAPKPEGEPKRGTYVPLPEKYRAPESSGLKYEVTKGTQTHDVSLE